MKDVSFFIGVKSVFLKLSVTTRQQGYTIVEMPIRPDTWLSSICLSHRLRITLAHLITIAR